LSTNNFENQIFPRKSKNGRTQIDGDHHFDDPANTRHDEKNLNQINNN